MILPFLIILVENPNIGSLSSLFEMKILFTLKIIVLFKKQMNFAEQFISSLIINIFDCYFIKNFHLKDNSLGTEIKNKILRKVNYFKFNLRFLIWGYIISGFWFYLIRDKLEFEIIDDSM